MSHIFFSVPSLFSLSVSFFTEFTSSILIGKIFSQNSSQFYPLGGIFRENVLKDKSQYLHYWGEKIGWNGGGELRKQLSTKKGHCMKG